MGDLRRAEAVNEADRLVPPSTFKGKFIWPKASPGQDPAGSVTVLSLNLNDVHHGCGHVVMYMVERVCTVPETRYVRTNAHKKGRKAMLSWQCSGDSRGATAR